MSNSWSWRQLSIIIGKISLIIIALGLCINLIFWFSYGMLRFAHVFAESVGEAWGAIAQLIGISLGAIVSSVIVFFLIFVSLLLLSRVAAFMTHYEHFRPEASIVYHLIAPVTVLAGFLAASPLILPYMVMQIFKGNAGEVIEQAQKVSSLIAPAPVKVLPQVQKYIDVIEESTTHR